MAHASCFLLPVMFSVTRSHLTPSPLLPSFTHPHHKQLGSSRTSNRTPTPMISIRPNICETPALQSSHQRDELQNPKHKLQNVKHKSQNNTQYTNHKHIHIHKSLNIEPIARSKITTCKPANAHQSGKRCKMK